MQRTLRTLLAAVILAASTGCSSFHTAWKTASELPPALDADTIEGRWEGRWESDRNHHNGRLRCIVTRQTNGLYSARFHANYRILFNLRFGYTAILDVTREDRRNRFSGEADLGWYAGGIYRYEGQATATHFVSTYSCKHDHGTFRMTRPRPATQAP